MKKSFAMPYGPMAYGLLVTLVTFLAGCASVPSLSGSNQTKQKLETQHCVASKGSIRIENESPQQLTSVKAAETIISKSECFDVVASQAQQPGMPPQFSSPQQKTDYVARISFEGKTDYHTGAKTAAMAGLAVVPIVGVFTMATGAVALTNTTTEEANVTITLCGHDGNIIATQKGTSKNFSLGVGAMSMMDSMSVPPGERQFGTACLDAFNKLVSTIEGFPLPVAPAKQHSRKKRASAD